MLNKPAQRAKESSPGGVNPGCGVNKKGASPIGAIDGLTRSSFAPTGARCICRLVTQGLRPGLPSIAAPQLLLHPPNATTLTEYQFVDNYHSTSNFESSRALSAS